MKLRCACERHFHNAKRSTWHASWSSRHVRRCVLVIAGLTYFSMIINFVEWYLSCLNFVYFLSSLSWRSLTSIRDNTQALQKQITYFLYRTLILQAALVSGTEWNKIMTFPFHQLTCLSKTFRHKWTMKLASASE